MPNKDQRDHVQPAVSAPRTWQSNLDTVAHPAQSRLNSCLAHARVWTGRFWIVTTLADNQGGDLFLDRLNLDTASCHRLAGTWLAPLRRVLALGHARTDQLTGQQEKENERALSVAGNGFTRASDGVPVAVTCPQPPTEPSGFLSLFTL